MPTFGRMNGFLKVKKDFKHIYVTFKQVWKHNVCDMGEKTVNGKIYMCYCVVCKWSLRHLCLTLLAKSLNFIQLFIPINHVCDAIVSSPIDLHDCVIWLVWKCEMNRCYNKSFQIIMVYCNPLALGPSGQVLHWAVWGLWKLRYMRKKSAGFVVVVVCMCRYLWKQQLKVTQRDKILCFIIDDIAVINGYLF